MEQKKKICKNAACASKVTCSLYWAWIEGQKASERETVAEVVAKPSCGHYAKK